MYEKLKELFPRTIDFILFVFMVSICIVSLGICIWCLSHRTGNSSDGMGLEQIEHTQQSITEGAGAGRKETESIRGEVHEAGNSVSRVRSYEQSSRELIEDCQRIIAEAKARGESKNK